LCQLTNVDGLLVSISQFGSHQSKAMSREFSCRLSFSSVYIDD
jgi:hypothetical protein